MLNEVSTKGRASTENSACAPACLTELTEQRLQQIADAWNTLPEQVRIGIFLIVMGTITGNGDGKPE